MFTRLITRNNLFFLFNHWLSFTSIISSFTKSFIIIHNLLALLPFIPFITNDVLHLHNIFPISFFYQYYRCKILKLLRHHLSCSTLAYSAKKPGLSNTSSLAWLIASREHNGPRMEVELWISLWHKRKRQQSGSRPGRGLNNASRITYDEWKTL